MDWDNNIVLLHSKLVVGYPLIKAHVTLPWQGGGSTKTHTAVKPLYMGDVGALAIIFFLDVIVSSIATEVKLLYSIFAF